MGGGRSSYLYYISVDVTGWTELITIDISPTAALWQLFSHFKFFFLEETPVDLMINTRAGAGLAGCAAWPPILITELSLHHTHGAGWGLEDDIGQQKKRTIRHELRAAMLVISSLVCYYS